MSYRTYQRGSGIGRALIAWLVVLGLAIGAIVVGSKLLSGAVVQPYIGRTIDENLQGQIGNNIVIPTQAPNRTGNASTVVITEQELNQGIQDNADQLGPLDSARIEITNDELIVHMSAYGASGRYRGNVETRDGKPFVTGGRVDGMLGWVVPANQLEAALNREIATAVDRSGVTVQSVALEPGRMLLTVA
jgi:hypothetical protein